MALLGRCGRPSHLSFRRGGFRSATYRKPLALKSVRHSRQIPLNARDPSHNLGQHLLLTEIKDPDHTSAGITLNDGLLLIVVDRPDTLDLVVMVPALRA